MLNERFADASPANAYYSLLDQGAYLASPSTMCRILRQHGEVGTDRCRQAAHPPRAVPELVADAPSVVWRGTSPSSAARTRACGTASTRSSTVQPLRRRLDGRPA